MTYTRTIPILALVAGALAAPAIARADTTPTDQRNAAQECRFERGSTDATREAFALQYGTNHNHKNAFGKCVSAKAREESQERADAAANAPQACRAEQGTTDESRAAFAQKYGTNKNGKNAFGKCVSAKAQELKATADEQDHAQARARKAAANKCAGKHGKALGKCVSAKEGEES
jgi:hypothetical protein